MKTWYYKFEDGYFCWTAGKMSKTDLALETKKHGKLIDIKVK